MHVRDGNGREYAYVKLAIIQDTYVLRTWPGRSSRRRKRPPRRERRRGSLAGRIFLGPYRRPVGYTNTTHTPPTTPGTTEEGESTQWPRGRCTAPGTDTSAPIQTRPSNAL
jgi:hypothetical protein